MSVSPFGDDHAALKRSLYSVQYEILTAETCEEASQILQRSLLSVVVCECILPDGTWRDLLNLTRKSPEEPLLIVSSRCADEKLWAEVLNLGGFDVVAKPFDLEELRHVLVTACLGDCVPARA